MKPPNLTHIPKITVGPSYTKYVPVLRSGPVPIGASAAPGWLLAGLQPYPHTRTRWLNLASHPASQHHTGCGCASTEPQELSQFFRVSTCSEISRFQTFQREKKYGWIAVIIHESRLCMQVKTKFIMVSYPKMTSPKMTRNCRGKKTQKNSDLARQPSVAMVHGCTVLQGPRTNSETLRNS